MNIGKRQKEVIIVEPLKVPVPDKIEIPAKPKIVEQPELVPIKR
jgi:hypothetical protein